MSLLSLFTDIYNRVLPTPLISIAGHWSPAHVTPTGRQYQATISRLNPMPTDVDLGKWHHHQLSSHSASFINDNTNRMTSFFQDALKKRLKSKEPTPGKVKVQPIELPHGSIFLPCIPLWVLRSQNFFLNRKKQCFCIFIPDKETLKAAIGVTSNQYKTRYVVSFLSIFVMEWPLLFLQPLYLSSLCVTHLPY